MRLIVKIRWVAFVAIVAIIWIGSSSWFIDSCCFATLVLWAIAHGSREGFGVLKSSHMREVDFSPLIGVAMAAVIFSSSLAVEREGEALFQNTADKLLDVCRSERESGSLEFSGWRSLGAGRWSAVVGDHGSNADVFMLSVRNGFDLRLVAIPGRKKRYHFSCVYGTLMQIQ